MGLSTRKPLVLLDIDGVLNAYPDDEGLSGAQELLWRAGGHGWTVTVANDTLEALRWVIPASHEVLWLTAWRDEANEGPMYWLREMQLAKPAETWDVITNGGGIGENGFTTDWKIIEVAQHPKVRQALRRGRPVVWIEDFNWHKDDRWIPRDVVEAMGIIGIDTGGAGRLTMDHVRENGELFDYDEGGSDFARRVMRTVGP